MVPPFPITATVAQGAVWAPGVSATLHPGIRSAPGACGFRRELWWNLGYGYEIRTCDLSVYIYVCVYVLYIYYDISLNEHISEQIWHDMQPMCNSDMKYNQ